MSALVYLKYALVAHLWANVAAQPRDLGETGQTDQGDAKELTPEQMEKQREAMAMACAVSAS